MGKESETSSGIKKPVSNVPNRVILVKDTPSKDNDKLVVYVNGKINLFTANPYSIALVPDIGTFTQQASAFSTAQAGVNQRTIGLAAARDVAKRPVLVSLDCYASLVQYTADQSPELAVLIIESYGYKAKVMPARFKKAVEARHGKVSGSIDLIAKAVARKAFYEWEESTDGHTWTSCSGDAKGSWYCDATVTGKTPGTTYFFRLQTVVGRNRSDFSDPVAVICL